MGKQRILLFLGQLLLFSGCTTQAPQTGPPGFDFTHVDLALHYFDRPSGDLITEVSTTEAARHLKRHSDRTGYYPPETSSLDITADLFSPSPDQTTLNQVKDLIQYAYNHPVRQRSCIQEAAAYLPGEARPANPLHITWGYDIGVAMDSHASLNFAHSHFLNDPEEIWFYCTHEMHHTGVMQLHPMSHVSEINTSELLYDFVRYATFLEGLAVYAAKEARHRSNALDNDPDYVALGDEDQLDLNMTRYWQQLAFLENQKDIELNGSHWKVVEDMSSGDRLWYVVGAAMASVIDDKLGRDGLLDTIRRGPDSFFDAYKRLE